MLSDKEVLECLCCYDERYPDYYVDEFSDKREPRGTCACDNCFYGRDELALEILELKEEVDNLKEGINLTY